MHSAAGDLEVLCSEGVDAEGLDDEGAEGCESRVGDLSTCCHDEEDPGLWVAGGLPCLVLFEVGVLYALAVSGHALDGDDALTLGEEVCGCGEVGEEEDRGDAHEHAGGSEDQEDVHPPWQARFDVSDCIPDEASKHRCDAIGAVVRFESQWLFSGGIPPANV